MDRAMLKQEAKDAMKMAKPHPAVVTLVYFGVAAVASIIIGFIGGLGTVGQLLSVLLLLVVDLGMIGVGYGYYTYVWKVYRGERTGIEELFSHMEMLLKMIGLSLWMGLFVWLWSLLFFIPGIIAGIRYSQAIFYMIENPDMGIRDCVNASKQMMKGRCMEYFVLTLSFIPWELLTGITFGIAGLYTIPYMLTTFAGYYERNKC